MPNRVYKSKDLLDESCFVSHIWVKVGYFMFSSFLTYRIGSDIFNSNSAGSGLDILDFEKNQILY